MSADEVLLRLRDVARGSLRHFVVKGDDGDVWPDLTTEEAEAKFHLLKKIKPKRRVSTRKDDPWVETEVELELHDAVTALTLLGRHHKLFTDKVESTGPNGGPIQHSHEFSDLKDLPPEELEQRLRAALS